MGLGHVEHRRLLEAVGGEVPLARDKHVVLIGFGSTPAGGSTTIAPYMPFAMCASTGFVPQWYMNTPASFAVNM